MKKKIKSSPAVLTFAFLLSGSIIHGLYYSAKNPIMSYICISVFLTAFTSAASAWFSGRKNISSIAYSKFFAVFAGILAVPAISYTVAVYARSLGTYADYYSRVHVTVFAVLSVIAAGIIGAAKGGSAICGFARMTAAVTVLWLLAGFLGFLYTKSFVLPASPFENSGQADFLDIAKNTALISFDTVLLNVVLRDNMDKSDKSDKKELSSQIFCGVLAFIAVSGINMLKNVLMFGEDFIMRLDNPDLAAISLIPMFELPEISVLINTFAVALRTAVYFCAVFYMLKDSLGASYSSKKTEIAAFCIVALAAFAMIYLSGALELSGYAGIISMGLCVIVCLAFFSVSEKS